MTIYLFVLCVPYNVYIAKGNPNILIILCKVLSYVSTMLQLAVFLVIRPSHYLKRIFGGEVQILFLRIYYFDMPSNIAGFHFSFRYDFSLDALVVSLL